MRTDKTLLKISLSAAIFSTLFAGYDTKTAVTMHSVMNVLGKQAAISKTVNIIICSEPGALRLIVYMPAENKAVGIEQCEKKWEIESIYEISAAIENINGHTIAETSCYA